MREWISKKLLKFITILIILVTVFSINTFTASARNVIFEESFGSLSVEIVVPTRLEVDLINGGYFSKNIKFGITLKNNGTTTIQNANITFNMPIGEGITVSKQTNRTARIGSIPAGKEKFKSYPIAVTIKDVDQHLLYTITISSDNTRDIRLQIPLHIPVDKGPQKLPVVFLHGVFGSTTKKGLSEVEYANGDLYPNLPAAMPAAQEDLVMYDNGFPLGILGGDTGYDDIVRNLRVDGYYAYTCPYDWRLSLEDIIAYGYLQNIIDKAKQETGQDKVIIIAHSMGGLVARYYIQSEDYRNDVEMLLMIGTPNNGSAFTYPILAGGQVVDDKNNVIDPLKFGLDRNSTENIIINAYSVMKGLSGNVLTSQELFDFLYIDKEIPAVITLNAQYIKLLQWDKKKYNPFIDNPDFESSISKLNQPKKNQKSNSKYMKEFYQPLTGKKAGKVRTAIFYTNDLNTVETWLVGSGPIRRTRYPDGYLKTDSKSIAQHIAKKGDGTVTSASAQFGASGAWTTIPLKKYGNTIPILGSNRASHANMVNAVDNILRGVVFKAGADKIDISSKAISNMRKRANNGGKAPLVSFSMSNMSPTTATLPAPYLFVNVIGDVNATLMKNGVSYGESYVLHSGNQMNISATATDMADDYTLNFSTDSWSESQHVYFTIEYFDGEALFRTDAEALLRYGEDKIFTFSITNSGIVARQPNSSVVSGRSIYDTAQLKWDIVDGADSYNIYLRNRETNEFIWLDNTSDTSYISNVMWQNRDEGSSNLRLYVEPVYAGSATDILMVSTPVKDYAEANFYIDGGNRYPGYAPQSVSFTDNSRGYVTSWLWDFGDGTTSTLQNPAHTYYDNKKYTVTLTVDGPSGFDTVVKTDYVLLGKHLIDIEFELDSDVVDVNEQFEYKLYGIYSTGERELITNGYELVIIDDEDDFDEYEDDEDYDDSGDDEDDYDDEIPESTIIGINGKILTALRQGSASIDVFYEDYVASEFITVIDSIKTIELANDSAVVAVGTTLDELNLPARAVIEFASGNIHSALITWEYDAEEFYKAMSDGIPFKIEGIVDILEELLPPEDLFDTVEEYEEFISRLITVYYTITFNEEETIPISLLTLMAGAGGRLTHGESGEYESGTEIPISALPNNGYRFKHWMSTNGGAFDNINSSLAEFTMPENDTIIMAVFEANDGNSGGTNPTQPEVTPPYIPPYIPPSYPNDNNSDNSSSSSNTSDSSYTSQDGSSSSYSSSTNADSQAQSITMLVNGVARSADPIANSYSRGRHTIRANTTKKENGSYNDSTFVIPISVFTSAYNATRTSGEIFKLMIETPIASTAIPSNITSIISNYTTLVRLHEAPFSIKVTIIDKSTTSPTDAISSVVEFKLELIDKNGKIIIEISEFDGIIEKIIPVNIRKPAYWGVWMRKDRRSSWTFVPAKWTASGVVVSNTTNSEYVVVEYKSKFTDVKKDQWYYENITHAASKRLVQGRNTDGTIYDPEGTVTRAEFVAMVVRALRLPDAKSTTTSYTDVKDSDWFIRDGTLMSAKSAGLLGLLEVNGEFKPNQSILREEMAYILARAAAYCSVKAGESVDLKARFEDFETIDNKYNTHVETVISLKLMQGMSATEFWGKSSVTRAQAATALINMCKIFDWID